MATYYVAPFGNDANAGTSPSAPFKTINKAAQVMVDGDVCYVAPGVYREAVNIPSPGSGTKRLTFIGDRDARVFTGAPAGEVRLDGSDDDVTSVRSTGVLINANVSVIWDRINVSRFSSYAFSIASSGASGEQVFRAFVVANSGIAFYMTGGASVNIRQVDVLSCTRAVQATSPAVVSAEDMLIDSVDIAFDCAGTSRIELYRVYHRASGSVRRTISANGGVAYLEDVVTLNGSLISYVTGNTDALIRRATVVKGQVGLNLGGGVADRYVINDAIFAECQTGISSSSVTVFVHRCAFPDTTTPLSGTIQEERHRWSTTTDGGGNVILPDFTPVGARIVRAEETNPIEGLRSARIDVPRIAYYKFLVAVSGANTIALKAKKSHATGTTVKFRVDEDPTKVVTLADTDQVQTVQLGPVADRGPRFVPLEVWCQQTDWIDGHYVLIDSIQVI